LHSASSMIGAPVSESKFCAELAEYAERLGFEVWPVNQTRSQPKTYMKKGHADLVLFGHNTTLYVETKVDRNKQSEPQRVFEQSATRNGSLYWIIHSTEEFLVCGKEKGWWR